MQALVEYLKHRFLQLHNRALIVALHIDEKKSKITVIALTCEFEIVHWHILRPLDGISNIDDRDLDIVLLSF